MADINVRKGATTNILEETVVQLLVFTSAEDNMGAEDTGQEFRSVEKQWADHVSEGILSKIEDYINYVVSELVAIEIFSKQFGDTANHCADSDVHYGNVLLELAAILGNEISERDKFLQLVQKVFEEYCQEAFKQSVFKLDIKISPFSWLTEGFLSSIFIDEIIIQVLRGLEVGKDKYGVDVIPTFVEEQDTWENDKFIEEQIVQYKVREENKFTPKFHVEKEQPNLLGSGSQVMRYYQMEGVNYLVHAWTTPSSWLTKWT